VHGLLTDNGSAFRSKTFKQSCGELGIKHRFTRAYRPQTNVKAERFIQSALREWAYGRTYEHSRQQRESLAGGSTTTTGTARTTASAASRP
jgi:transposase InsO family protein